MHVGDGTVTIGCALVGAGAAIAGVTAATLMARRGPAPQAGRLAAATGLVFALQAWNLPALPGASGHLLGGFLLAALVGRWWAVLAMTTVLLAQSLMLGDGGWTALGLNITTMALVPCLVAFPLWERFFGKSTGATRWTSIALGAWTSAVLAAAVLGLAVNAVGTMTLTHAAIGVIEALGTVAVLALAARANSLWAYAGATAAVLAAATWGACPWPDGYEYTLALRGIDIPEAAFASPQWMLPVACAVVIGITLGLQRALKSRVAPATLA